jgi:hypothetical protein
MLKIRYGTDVVLPPVPMIEKDGADFVSAPTLAAGDARLFTDAQILTALAAEAVAFTSMSELPSIGDTLTGATSTETGVVVGVVITSGTIGGGDAAGTLYLKSVSGVLQAENLDNTTSTTNDVATIGGDSTAGLVGVGPTGHCQPALTAAETTCKKGTVFLRDAAGAEWEDQSVPFETYGHASAEHPLLDPVQWQKLGYFLDGMEVVTIDAGSTAILFVTDLAEATAEHYAWQELWMVTGALAGQKIPIVGYEADGDLRVANRTSDAPAQGDIGILV